MERVALDNGGWFDAETAIRFDEDTYWNGSNRISIATGSQWDHEALYYTKGGNWVLNQWSQYQGARETYEKISEARAIDWLIKNDRTEELEDLPEKVRKAIDASIAEREV